MSGVEIICHVVFCNIYRLKREGDNGVHLHVTDVLKIVIEILLGVLYCMTIEWASLQGVIQYIEYSIRAGMKHECLSITA